jgi:hypothetical protein
LEADRRGAAGDLAADQALAQAQQIGARLLDVDVDRIESLDGRQRIFLPGLNQRSGRVE